MDLSVVDLVAQVGVENLRGGYIWNADLVDGTTISQYRWEHDRWVEQSIDVVRESALRRIVLTPIYLTHRRIILEVAADERWAKTWVVEKSLQVMQGTVTQSLVADKLEITSVRAVRLYIYPNGDLKLTTGEA